MACLTVRLSERGVAGIRPWLINHQWQRALIFSTDISPCRSRAPHRFWSGRCCCSEPNVLRGEACGGITPHSSTRRRLVFVAVTIKSELPAPEYSPTTPSLVLPPRSDVDVNTPGASGLPDQSRAR